MKIRVSPETYRLLQEAKKVWNTAAWRPNSVAQALAITSTVAETLLEGNRGGGKTITLLMTYAVHVDKGYGAAWRGIIFRNTYKALEDIINQSKKVFWRIWPTATFNETERLWKFPNGETLKFSQFATPDDYYTWHGQEFPFIGWEELTNYPTPACYKSMMSCNRSSVMGVPKIIRATTNPSGPGKRWVKTYFDLPTSRNQVRTGLKDEDGFDMQDRLAIHFKFEDNIDLVKADPAYMTRVRQSAANNEIKKAWVEGDWNAQSGGYFDDVFEPSVHMIPKFVIPSGWPLIRAFDWGSAHPYSFGIYTVAQETMEVEIRTTPAKMTIHGIEPGKVEKMKFIRGDVIRIFEDYGWNGSPNQGIRMMPSMMAKRFKALETKWGIHGICQAGPAGIDLWDGSKGVSPITSYEEQDIEFYKAHVASGSRIAGLQLVRSMLYNANPKDELGNPMIREKPGLFFIEANNAQALRLFLEIMPDPDNPDDFMENAEDHIFDEIRYFITRRDNSFAQHHG